MPLNALLSSRQDSCKVCPDSPPPCNCSQNQDCVLINRDCNNCALFKCIPKNTGQGVTSGHGGVSNGAVAGAVIGSLLFVFSAIGLYLWYRRRTTNTAIDHAQEKDIPAPAETVLSRPDPIEKRASQLRDLAAASQSPPPQTPVYMDSDAYRHSDGAQPNPFDDQNSIQTAGTEGTNVIPIALVPLSNSMPSESSSTSSLGPMRPARSPELNLNLDHVNVSRDSLRTGAPSTRSDVSAASSRMSYMTNGSYASEFLKETPTIVTPTKASLRQVVGVVKAEVIQTPASPTPSSGLRPPPRSRPSVASPLAQAFGPADLAQESEGNQEVSAPGNPFSDEHSARGGTSPSSTTTFGVIPPSPATASTWVMEEPRRPWAESGDSRPGSISSQTGTITADIGSATRVFLGADHMAASPYRAVGKLVSPSTGRLLGTLEEQQQRALAHAQAQAKAQGLDPKRRISGSSVLSTSTRADSILEAFPFVPPSPISNRPIRSPPVSPLPQQAPKIQSDSQQQVPSSKDPAIETPNRHFLGLSTASQFSTASTGLGSFTFQIEPIDNSDPTSHAPHSASRASLDTIAITNDLSSYPLPFESSFGLSKN